MMQEDIILIPGVLQLHYLENSGAAFSILTGRLFVFYILTPLLCLLILWFFLRIPADNSRFIWLQLICILLFSGAIGNFIDRIRLHYVIDFIYFSLIDFPVFNVADIYVTVAAFALVIFILFYYKEDELSLIIPSKKSRESVDE